MASATATKMPIDPGELRDIDRWILDYLQEKQCVTPVYCRERVRDDHGQEVTSTYCGQRLQRLAEHGHAENLSGVGLYELVSDPRD